MVETETRWNSDSNLGCNLMKKTETLTGVAGIEVGCGGDFGETSISEVGSGDTSWLADANKLSSTCESIKALKRSLSFSFTLVCDIFLD